MPLFDQTRGDSTILSFTAENAIAKYCFVAKGTGAKQVTATTTEGGAVVGVAIEAAAAGDQVQILTRGVTLVKAGAAVTRGTFCKIDSTDGMVDDVTLGVTTVKHIVGQALEAATNDGDLISFAVGANQHGAV